MDIRGLKITETFPNQLVILFLVEPDLDVVLVDLVAEQEDLLASRHWTGSLSQTTNGEVTLGL